MSKIYGIPKTVFNTNKKYPRFTTLKHLAQNPEISDEKKNSKFFYNFQTEKIKLNVI